MPTSFIYDYKIKIWIKRNINLPKCNRTTIGNTRSMVTQLDSVDDDAHSTFQFSNYLSMFCRIVFLLNHYETLYTYKLISKLVCYGCLSLSIHLLFLHVDSTLELSLFVRFHTRTIPFCEEVVWVWLQQFFSILNNCSCEDKKTIIKQRSKIISYLILKESSREGLPKEFE